MSGPITVLFNGLLDSAAAHYEALVEVSQNPCRGNLTGGGPVANLVGSAEHRFESHAAKPTSASATQRSRESSALPPLSSVYLIPESGIDVLTAKYAGMNISETPVKESIQFSDDEEYHQCPDVGVKNLLDLPPDSPPRRGTIVGGGPKPPHSDDSDYEPEEELEQDTSTPPRKHSLPDPHDPFPPDEFDQQATDTVLPEFDESTCASLCDVSFGDSDGSSTIYEGGNLLQCSARVANDFFDDDYDYIDPEEECSDEEQAPRPNTRRNTRTSQPILDETPAISVRKYPFGFNYLTGGLTSGTDHFLLRQCTPLTVNWCKSLHPVEFHSTHLTRATPACRQSSGPCGRCANAQGCPPVIVCRIP